MLQLLGWRNKNQRNQEKKKKVLEGTSKVHVPFLIQQRLLYLQHGRSNLLLRMTISQFPQTIYSCIQLALLLERVHIS